MATNKQIIGEIIPKRTANAKHYLLLDGTKQAMIYGGDIHFTDEYGNWQNIDTALFDEADFDKIQFPVYTEKATEFHSLKSQAAAQKTNQTLDRSKGYFHGLRVPHNTKIAKQWRKGYQIGKGTDSLKFVPVGASPTFGYVDPADSSKIEYQDAWNDTDVCLELQTNGVKETITLKSASAPTTFTFQVIGNLTASTMTAGQLAIQPAWLQDANGTKKDVTQATRTDASGNTFLDLVADTTGLAFPVVIDPTVTISETANSSGTANQSTELNQAQPTTAQGTVSAVTVGIASTGSAYRMLLQLDVSTIPANADIVSASLYLETYSNQLTGPANTVNPFTITPYQNTASWAQNTVTWNTKPAIGTAATSAISYAWTSPPPASTWYNCNVANIVQNWVNGQANYGFQLISNVDTSSNVVQYFNFYAGGQGSSSPYLSINYDVPPTAPGAITAPAAGATVNSTQTITWGAASDSSSGNLGDSALSGTSFTAVANQSGSYVKGCQKFTTLSDATYLNNVEYKLNVPNGSAINLTVSVWSLDGSGNPLSQIGVVGTLSGTGTGNTSTSNMGCGISLQPNTQYGLVFTAGNTTQHSLVYTTTQPTGFTGYSTWQSYGTSTWTAQSYYIDAYLSFSTAPSQLTYQIDYSGNNGSTWTNIVSATAAGATSYTYDFTNTAATSTALLRVRAYDGQAYGPYTTMSGVFTIQHNVAPNAPTGLTPTGNTPLDLTQAVTFNWTYSNTNSSDTQSKFDLQWSSNGGSTWNTITVTSPNSTYTAAANTFPHGQIVWQVRTYDQSGLAGPYSSQATFFAGNVPATPTITSPANNATVAVAQPTVQWSSSGQTDYQLQALQGATVVYDSTDTISTNKAATIGTNLSNNTTYTLQVRIKNSDGLWSAWATVSVTVSFTTPATTTITLTPSNANANIVITITNPTPSGTQPTVSGNDLYRRVTGSSTWTRIATGIANNGSYTDYAVASGTSYDYYVQTNGTNGTYGISATVTTSGIVLNGLWIHAVNNPSGTIIHVQYQQDFKKSQWVPDSAALSFAGRNRPVVEFGEQENYTLTAQKATLLTSDANWPTLDALLRQKTTLCVRDGRGRKVFCTVPGGYQNQDDAYGQVVDVNFTEIAYSEAV